MNCTNPKSNSALLPFVETITSKSGTVYPCTLDDTIEYDRDLFAKLVNELRKGSIPTLEQFRLARKIGAKICRVKKLVLLSSSQTKMRASRAAAKAQGIHEVSYILHMAPADRSGYEVCAGRSKGCTKACLNGAGQGFNPSVQAGRRRKTRFYFEHRALFLLCLYAELALLANRSYRVSVRLNGTSDIMFERWEWLFTSFPSIQCYDYTKIAKRFAKKLPDNYRLTFSRSESNSAQMSQVWKRGGNVAVVFSPEIYDRLMNQDSPTYMGRPVFDMKSDDRRYLDPSFVGGGVGALKALGPAVHDTTGFVVRSLRTDRLALVA